MNLWNSFSTEPFGNRVKDTKFMIETILIGFFIGLVLMPGGNFQMQYYSRYFVPILIQMIGLPNSVVFWVYQLVFPVEHVPPFIKTELAADFKAQ